LPYFDRARRDRRARSFWQDSEMLAVSWDTVRLFLHILAPGRHRLVADGPARTYWPHVQP
ncbi:MAG TPA: hypothetical protein VF070_39025, partial [Streptosporangiaceae bacterium]